jgi:hypothetical protein
MFAGTEVGTRHAHMDILHAYSVQGGESGGAVKLYRHGHTHQ